jgi:hypothetical protein
MGDDVAYLRFRLCKSVEEGLAISGGQLELESEGRLAS